MSLENKVSCSTKMNLLCLPDEILLIILNKLNNTDVLTRERKFSRKIDRFSFELIPRIKENIQLLILDDLSIEQVLSLGYYPNLSQLTLINIPIEFISRRIHIC